MRAAIVFAVAMGCALPAPAQQAVTGLAKSCRQGLYPQPGGPFSVFVFCDDAAGVNIGVVNTKPRGGSWDVDDRFWQERAWATDITSFAWSPDLRSLYVGTSEIYGSGNLYKLDLVNRKSEVLVPKPDWKVDPKAGHSTEILAIDAKSGSVSVEYSVDERRTVQRMEVK